MRLHRVFVFGTLKEGFPNFGTNKGRRLGDEFVTCQAYPLFLVGERHSPWLVDQPGDGLHVEGQVFEVDDSILAAMDQLERVQEDDGYLRAAIEVEPLKRGVAGPAIEAFAYLKKSTQLRPFEIRVGPLAVYTLAHAALYRSRPATS